MCIIRKDLNFKVKREKANSTDLHMDNNMIMKKNTLEKMKDENYTSVSSVNIDELVHLLRKENPEVARDLIAQMPETIKGLSEIESLSVELASLGISSCEKSLASSINAHQKIIDACIIEAHNSDDKQVVAENIDIAREEARLIDQKDSEHRKTITTIIGATGAVLGIGLIIAGSLYLIDAKNP